CRQRKLEERDAARVARRHQALVRSRQVTTKEAAWKVIPSAYLKVSGGTLPAKARQVMYAARREIQEQTGEMLDDVYFTQRLLPDYVREHPDETRDWDIVFDARGHFTEPHTERIVPLGTIDVRQYLDDVSDHRPGEPRVEVVGGTFPTSGPARRF